MYQQYVNQAKAAIDYLSSDELKELLNDDEKLEERVNEVLKSLEDEKEVIISDNRSLAEENVNKEPEIIERKGRISELAEQGKTLCTSVQSKLTEMKERKGDNTPDTALALLQAAAAEGEETSDKLVTKLNEKELPTEDFLEQFLAARKTMHLRKLKAEKMIDLLREEANKNRSSTGIGGGGGFPGYGNNGHGTPYPPSNFFPPGPTGHGAPYPTGPLPMPMPNMMFRHF